MKKWLFRAARADSSSWPRPMIMGFWLFGPPESHDHEAARQSPGPGRRAAGPVGDLARKGVS